MKAIYSVFKSEGYIRSQIIKKNVSILKTVAINLYGYF